MSAAPRMTTPAISAGQARLRPPPGLPAARAARATFLLEEAFPIAADEGTWLRARCPDPSYIAAWGRPRAARCAHARTVRTARATAITGSRARRTPFWLRLAN